MEEITEKTAQRLIYTHKDFSDRLIVQIALLELCQQMKTNPDRIREEYGIFFLEHISEVNKTSHS